MQKLTKFKVIFDLFTVCVYFIQQQNCKLYYIYLIIISEIQSEIRHCSCDSAKFKAPTTPYCYQQVKGHRPVDARKPVIGISDQVSTSTTY